MDDTPKIQGKPLKLINVDDKNFTANGTEYFIETSLSVNRYLMYQKLQIEASYEIGFYKLFEQIKKIFELCDKMKFAEIAVLTHNIMNGMNSIDEKRIPALQICALFINEKNEDRGMITDDMVKKKTTDWEKEGIDIFSFFQLAIAFIPGYLNVYKEISLSISQVKAQGTFISSLLKKKPK